MKKILLALTALTAIAACAAAASPSARMANAAPVSAVEAPAADLAGPHPVQAAAPISAERVSTSARPVCDILTRATSHGVAIRAVLTANAPVSGDYNLVITKIGAGGSSDVQQGGAYNARGGERVTLSETELGLERGDRFHAVLTLTDADGRVCRQELRS